MTDVATTTPEANGNHEPFITDIPLKFGLKLEGINIDEIPIEAYKRWIIKGAQLELTTARMGKKASGITKLEGAAKEKAMEEFLAQCQANLDDIKAGKELTKTKGSAKVSGAVGIEAMRLAKLMVKQCIRDQNQKVGAYSAKEITEYAKKVLEANPELVQKAEENLAARAGDMQAVKGLDIFSLAGDKARTDEVKAKPKVPPKAPGKKGEKAPLSAKQAALVAPRQKPGFSPAHTH